MIVVVARVRTFDNVWFEVWNYNTYFNGEYSQFTVEMYKSKVMVDV